MISSRRDTGVISPRLDTAASTGRSRQPPAMASRDRLPQLRQASAASGLSAASEPSEPPEQGPGAGAADVSCTEDMRRIFEEAEQLLRRTRELHENTALLQRLHADPTFHANKVVQEQLDAVISESNTLAADIGAALVRLEGLARAAGGVAGAGAVRNDVRARIARLQYLSARRRYADALGSHRRLLAAVRDQQARLLHDQLKLTKLAMTEEECEALLDNNNISLFVDNVRAETAEARLALRAVEARRDELVRVEAALRDVRDMFQRLAQLVADQQEQIDSVQHFALQATDYVESGEHQLLQGVVKRAKGNKKKIQLIICIVVGFAVVLLVLIVT